MLAGAIVSESSLRYLIKEVIFVSSTSVYAMLNREVTETDIDWQSDHVLVRAEKLFLAETLFRTSILRLSGLIGDDRIPAKYLSGKKNVAGGNDPVNWVYRKDVARIVEQMILQDKLGEIFNISCPIQPLRKEVYAKNCADMNMESVEFIDNYSVEGFKKINSDKMISALNYRFLYPDPMGFPYVKK